MNPKELTLRGLILGSLITLIFTAANVYLGLKVGLTFASSIPAAVRGRDLAWRDGETRQQANPFGDGGLRAADRTRRTRRAASRASGVRGCTGHPGALLLSDVVSRVGTNGRPISPDHSR
jgi:OPT oligopeptide transporter protein